MEIVDLRMETLNRQFESEEVNSYFGLTKMHLGLLLGKDEVKDLVQNADASEVLHGMSLLHMAAYGGNINVLGFLMGHFKQIDMNKKDNLGLTALDMVKSRVKHHTSEAELHGRKYREQTPVAGGHRASVNKKYHNEQSEKHLKFAQQYRAIQEMLATYSRIQ